MTKTLSNILGPTLFEADADWLQENAPDYYAAVETAVNAGHTPKAIYTFYMQQVPNRQALWLRCQNAAEWMLIVKAKE